MLKLISIIFLFVLQAYGFTEIVPKQEYMNKIVSVGDPLGVKPLEYVHPHRYADFEMAKFMKTKPELFGEIDVIKNKKTGAEEYVAMRLHEPKSELEQNVIDVQFAIGHNFLTTAAGLLETLGLNNLNYLGNMHRNLIKDGAIFNSVNEDGGLIHQGIIQFVIAGFVTFIVAFPIIMLLGLFGVKGFEPNAVLKGGKL